MKNILFPILLLLGFVTFGQQGDGGEPNGYNYFLKMGKDIPTYRYDQPDISALRAEDRIVDSLKTGPWRFGYNYSTSINLENSAEWYTKSNGDKVGILKITSDQAKTINLTFANTQIPEGNELFIYNEDKSFVLGKFTQNHIYKGELGTELVPGSTVIVEYFVPAENTKSVGNVEISKVTHGYRTAQEFQTKAFGSSGSCNMNVNCPDGAPYVSQRNSALMLVSGSNGFCSGALINNTNFDGKPYVLTANHCYGSGVTNWVFRFNWQSDNCDNPSSSPSFTSLSGSTLRARRANSDFLLIEITGGLTNGKIPQIHTPFFAGWNRGNAAPTSSVSIHHPSGDIKKISFDDDPAVAVQAMGSPEANSSWMVEWDRNTTTEGGSSGSPLFNQDGQIIGQLWGGDAGCSGTSSSGKDYYGRVYNSWQPTGSSNSGQLKYWLDPMNTGDVSITGYDPYLSDYNIAVTKITGHEDKSCEKSFTPSVQIQNKGSVTITSFVIKYSYNNGSTQNINWTGNLPLYAYATITLPTFNQIDGLNSIEVSSSNPNGQTDQDPSDNQLNTSFKSAPNGTVLDFKFYLGCYADEVSWEFNEVGGAATTLYSGGGYTSSNSSNLVEKEFCVVNGCYRLILKDSYGDGVEGAIYNNCNFTGSMTLTQRVSNIVWAELTEQNANFGFQKFYNFCINNVSLETEELENSISIYPNPSKGEFTIVMDFEGDKNVVLRNITGKTVASYQSSDNELQVSGNNLSAGMYMVTISNVERSVTRKIIVE